MADPLILVFTFFIKVVTVVCKRQVSNTFNFFVINQNAATECFLHYTDF